MKEYFAGLDAGSTNGKIVVIDGDGKIIDYNIFEINDSYEKLFSKNLKLLLKKNKIYQNQIKAVVSCGYGNEAITFKDDSITEITALAIGNKEKQKKIDYILDIGGQDTKIIKLNKKGIIENFIMNDICAAGTGRFLEVMCRRLKINLKDIYTYYKKAKNEYKISSMCTVFAETEIISLMSKNINKNDIVKSIISSIIRKIIIMFPKNIKNKIISLNGGICSNKAIIEELQTKSKSKFIINKNPQILGGLGAALYGKRQYEKRE